MWCLASPYQHADPVRRFVVDHSYLEGMVWCLAFSYQTAGPLRGAELETATSAHVVVVGGDRQGDLV